MGTLFTDQVYVFRHPFHPPLGMTYHENTDEPKKLSTFGLASTTGFILAPTAVAQTACKRQRQRCLWLAIYFIPNQKSYIRDIEQCNEPAMYPKILEAESPDIASKIYGT